MYSLQLAFLKAPYLFEYFHGDLQDSSQVVILDQTIAEYFDVYEHWLLRGELLLTGEIGKAKDAGPTKQQAKSRYNKLLYCCSLACALGNNVFLDALVTELVYTLRRADSFQSQFTSPLTRERVGKVVADSSVHSGFFKLVALSYARFATVDDIRVLAFSNYNIYFKSQVMQSMASLRISQHIDGVEAQDFVVGVCHFHTHGFYEGHIDRSGLHC